MSKEKSKRNDLQSEDREFPEKVSVPKQEPKLVSFDIYFRKMMFKDKSVQEHHKAPMKNFAIRRGLSEATEEQFEEIFRSY